MFSDGANKSTITKMILNFVPFNYSMSINLVGIEKTVLPICQKKGPDLVCGPFSVIYIQFECLSSSADLGKCISRKMYLRLKDF